MILVVNADDGSWRATDGEYVLRTMMLDGGKVGVDAGDDGPGNDGSTKEAGGASGAG